MYASTDTAEEIAPRVRRAARRPGPVGAGALERVRAARAEVAAGRAVVLVGDRGDADLVLAAEMATPSLLSFVVRHTAGFVCVALHAQDADRLDLSLLSRDGRASADVGQCVAVDAREGIGTGISAADRARTIQLLGDRETTATDLARPGHVVTLRVGQDGVLGHRNRAEAAVDLAGQAGLRPAAALSALVSPTDSRTMAHGVEPAVFARAHGLQVVSVGDLVTYRMHVEQLVERRAQATMPLSPGRFTAVGYHGRLDGAEHIALVHGVIGDGEDVPVHLHLECPAGDLLGTARCGCGPRLQGALADIAAKGRGVAVYLRRSAGRTDLVQGLLDPHEPADGLALEEREQLVGRQILRDLGVRSTRPIAT